MISRMLSAKQIDAIQERLHAQAVTTDDVERLLFTVRKLLEEKTGKGGLKGPREAVIVGQAASVDSPSIPRPVLAEVFTDGACEGNPGPGGWGAIVRMNGTEKDLSGGERHTTNNRMELSAAIEALKVLPASSRVVLTTDSQYVQKGITQWIKNWKRNGWLNASKQPVKNADLWRDLDALCEKHSVEWRWVKGHAGHAENERCDELARQAIGKLQG